MVKSDCIQRAKVEIDASVANLSVRSVGLEKAFVY